LDAVQEVTFAPFHFRVTVPPEATLEALLVKVRVGVGAVVTSIE